MTTWRDAGPEGWKTPPVLDVSGDCCQPDSGEVALLITSGAQPPDRVRLPPELGSRELFVIGEAYEVAQPCLACGDGGLKPMLELEDDYVVLHCRACGQYNFGRRGREGAGAGGERNGEGGRR